MTIEFEDPVLGWRTLKDIYHHYLKRTPSEEGISAAEVIERAEKGTRLREVAVQVLTAMPPEEAAQVLASVKEDKDQAARMRQITIHIMVRDAVAGLWFAIGRKDGVGAHQFIHPSDWNFLLLNIEKGAVGRDNLRFDALRCAFTRDVPENHPIRAAIYGQDDTPDSAHDITAGIVAKEMASPPTVPSARLEERHDGPGRPSTFHLVECEFERRIKQNALEPTLNKQTQALSTWFKNTHPRLRPYRPKTIANRLRDRYRAATTDLKNRPKL